MPLREALPFGGQAPSGAKRLEVREGIGQQRAGHRATSAALALVVVDPLGGHLVQVAAEDLLVVERECGNHSRLQHDLRRLERVAVLQRVLLERHRRHLLRQPFAAFFGGTK